LGTAEVNILGADVPHHAAAHRRIRREDRHTIGVFPLGIALAVSNSYFFSSFVTVRATGAPSASPSVNIVTRSCCQR
jgi:hypothetical protein